MINRRKFLQYSSLGCFGATLLNSCNQNDLTTDSQKKINRPNIIVLIADDLRWDCLGILNKIIQTPNLDLLANQGILFSNNFVTTAICPTSRASIFTGLYGRTHGIWDFDQALSKKHWRQTYPYLLKQNDYNTAFIGKWGMGGKLPKRTFDYWGGFAEQGNYYTVDRKEHLTSYLTSQAEEYIASQTQNFCLTMSYKAPHVDEDPDDPFIPDSKFARQYQDITIPRHQIETQNLPNFLQDTEAKIRYKQRFGTEKLYQQSVKNYYRLVSGIDESIGRIVQAVKQKNFTQDTYIIFTSDNGFFLGEKGLAGKWFGFEPAIRTPMIINCVDKPNSQPKIVTDMSLNIDIAPTVLALSKIDFPQAELFHGRNLMTTQHMPRQQWFYEHLYQNPEVDIPINIGIRSLQYKYLHFPEQNYEMLFDLKQDPQENINLAQDDQHQTQIREYRQLVQQSSSDLAS